MTASYQNAIQNGHNAAWAWRVIRSARPPQDDLKLAAMILSQSTSAAARTAGEVVLGDMEQAQ